MKSTTTRKSEESTVYTVRLNKEAFGLLADYQANLKKINRRPVDLGETIELLLVRFLGLNTC